MHKSAIKSLDSELVELLEIKEECADIIELIDITKTTDSIKVPVPIDYLKTSELLDIKALSNLQVLPNDKKVMLEIPAPIPIIEIPSDHEPCPTAPEHPRIKRKLPWALKQRSADSNLPPGEYTAQKITIQEIQEDKAKLILQNCKKLSKCKISVESQKEAELNELVIEAKIQLMFLPAKIWRMVKIPFTFTFEYIRNVVFDLFDVNADGGMFVFYGFNKEKVFLNSPCKTDEEKNSDEEIIKKSSVMDLMNFDYSELYFICGSEDFWFFSIRIKNLSQRNQEEKYPMCIGGRFLRPPNGITPSKFAKVVKVLNDSNSEKHEKYLEKYHEWKYTKFRKQDARFPSFE